MIGYYTNQELIEMGFAQIGDNVKISKTTTLYNCNNIFLGSNIRIDNFCTIAMSGLAKLYIGNYVHISAYNFLNGAEELIIEDFVTTAPYVRIFTSTDDYSGKFMTGAVVPRDLIGTSSKRVLVQKHSIIGVGSSILPGVVISKGTAVGAHSFVKDSTDVLSIVAGVPARKIGERQHDLIDLEKKINE